MAQHTGYFLRRVAHAAGAGGVRCRQVGNGVGVGRGRAVVQHDARQPVLRVGGDTVAQIVAVGGVELATVQRQHHLAEAAQLEQLGHGQRLRELDQHAFITLQRGRVGHGQRDGGGGQCHTAVAHTDGDGRGRGPGDLGDAVWRSRSACGLAKFGHHARHLHKVTDLHAGSVGRGKYKNTFGRQRVRVGCGLLHKKAIQAGGGGSAHGGVLEVTDHHTAHRHALAGQRADVARALNGGDVAQRRINIDSGSAGGQSEHRWGHHGWGCHGDGVVTAAAGRQEGEHQDRQGQACAAGCGAQGKVVHVRAWSLKPPVVRALHVTGVKKPPRANPFQPTSSRCTRSAVVDALYLRISRAR